MIIKTNLITKLMMGKKNIKTTMSTNVLLNTDLNVLENI